MQSGDPIPAIVNGLEGVIADRELHLAIGMFDGVHLGHQAVIDSAVLAAEGARGLSAVLTFTPHPSRLISPNNPTALIQTRDSKNLVLRRLGVDIVIWQEFTRAFAAIPAGSFVHHLVSHLPHLCAIHVGENFRYGKDRTGDIDSLIEEGRAEKVGVFSIERIRFNGEPISSSRIRAALANGGIEDTNALLGYRYFSSGEVQPGRSLGRSIGFPTVNLPWNPECRPRFGVYTVLFTGADGKQIPGVANYGIRPTITGSEACENPLLEVHCLDPVCVQPDDTVCVEWIQFIRSEQRFASIEELKLQIDQDVRRARVLLEGIS